MVVNWLNNIAFFSVFFWKYQIKSSVNISWFKIATIYNIYHFWIRKLKETSLDLASEYLKTFFPSRLITACTLKPNHMSWYPSFRSWLMFCDLSINEEAIMHVGCDYLYYITLLQRNFVLCDCRVRFGHTSTVWNITVVRVLWGHLVSILKA